MDIDNAFEVPLPPARAWAVLLDIKRIAGCIPGAELTEVVDERTYKGRVAVRLGPVALTLVGQATFEHIDNDTHTARVKCKGSDPKGRGATDSMIEFRIGNEARRGVCPGGNCVRRAPRAAISSNSTRLRSG